MPRTTAATRPATGSAGHRAALTGLTDRHWRLLTLIAEHGGFTTIQITTLLFDSRPTAVRHLRDLHTAGLLVRTTARRDPSHLAHYTISEPGAHALQQRLRETGRTRIPPGLGRRGQHDRTQPVANDFFVRLVAHARSTGQGHLYRWHHALDTAAWLHHHGITAARPNGDGIWIQDNTSVRFLLHIDNDLTPDQTRASSPLTRLFGYDHAPAGVPADVALVITPTELWELRLHLELADAPFPLPVAATTRSRLNDAPSPAEPIWTISPDTDELLSLVEVARLGATSRTPSALE